MKNNLLFPNCYNPPPKKNSKLKPFSHRPGLNPQNTAIRLRIQTCPSSCQLSIDYLLLYRMPLSILFPIINMGGDMKEFQKAPEVILQPWGRMEALSPLILMAVWGVLSCFSEAWRAGSSAANGGGKNCLHLLQKHRQVFQQQTWVCQPPCPSMGARIGVEINGLAFRCNCPKLSKRRRPL